MDSRKTQNPGQQASECLKASVILVENSAPGLKKPICHKFYYSEYVWEKVSAEFHFCSSKLFWFTKTHLVQARK